LAPLNDTLFAGLSQDGAHIRPVGQVGVKYVIALKSGESRS